MSKYRNDIDLAYENYKNYNDINDIDKMNITDNYDDEFNLSNISSIINYIVKNKIQFLLLLSVFIIIYTVDYINQLNSMLFNVSNFIPGMGFIQNNNSNTINLPSVKKSNIKNNRLKK